MAKNAASEDALGLLHKKVATVLTDALDGDEVNGAILGAAITFLKNNSITADVTHNEGLAKLSDALNRKRQNSKDRLKEFQAAEAEFHRQVGDLGGTMQ